MQQLQATIEAEWQWLCLLFEGMCKPFLAVRTIGKPKIEYVIPDLEKLTGEQPTVIKKLSDVVEVQLNHGRRQMADQGLQGRVAFTFQADMANTHILAEFDHAADEEYTKHILGILLGAAQQARKYKQEGEKIKAERLIAYYYEAKENNTPVTLAQLAQSYGYNESYLRQAHIKYKRDRSQTAPNKKPNNGRIKAHKKT